MIVGSEDFRHKLTYGWKGRKNGRASNKRGFGRHHQIMFLLWDAYVKQWPGAKDLLGLGTEVDHPSRPPMSSLMPVRPVE